MMKLSILAAFLAASANAGAPELTLDNFESTIGGKNAFVKFLAPVSNKRSSRTFVALSPVCRALDARGTREEASP